MRGKRAMKHARNYLQNFQTWQGENPCHNLAKWSFNSVQIINLNQNKLIVQCSNTHDP